MAEFTINSAKYSVNGPMRDQYYNVSGSSGSTLTVGLVNIRQVNCGAAAGITMVPGTAPGTTQITMTGGPFSNTNVQVVGN